MSGLDVMLDGVEWKRLPEPADPTELHATHEGWLDIMDFRLKCYVLNDGQRVFDADVVADLFRADDAGEET